MNPLRNPLTAAVGALILASTLTAQETSAPPAPAAELDFGNFSSETLTSKAWQAMNAKDYETAKAYANKCIEMYQAQAVEMQKGLSQPATEKEEVFKSWALNDVGTSYFILGQALEAQSKGKEAIAPYKFLVENLSYAQCWDAKGWFWKPADAARERIKALEFDAME